MPRQSLPKPHRRFSPLQRRGILLLAVVALLALLLPPSDRSVQSRPADQDASALLDGFERPDWPDPQLWQVVDSAAPTWWPSTCRTKTGEFSLRAFGGLIGDTPQPCGAGAPANSLSTIYLQLDLAEAEIATVLDLSFELWIDLPDDDSGDSGFFVYLHVADESSDVERIPVFGATGNSAAWTFPARRLDLMNLADIRQPTRVFDLRGRRSHLEFSAVAPRGSSSSGGIYIDDLRLRWEPNLVIPPPTRRPFEPSPSPSPTASASVTPSPSPTQPADTATPLPSPTEAPERNLGYLPLGLLAASLRPEIEPTETPSPEPERWRAFLPIGKSELVDRGEPYPEP